MNNETPHPAYLYPHSLSRSASLGAAREFVWEWLCDPRTFTRGNLPPYGVEFLDSAGEQAGFTEGVLTNHHGPFLNLPAVIRAVSAPSYRDMHYMYGSFVLSAWLIRPTRLQFWITAKKPQGCTVRVQLDSQVRTGIGAVWTGAQVVFWSVFLLGMRLKFRK